MNLSAHAGGKTVHVQGAAEPVLVQDQGDRNRLVRGQGGSQAIERETGTIVVNYRAVKDGAAYSINFQDRGEGDCLAGGCQFLQPVAALLYFNKFATCRQNDHCPQ